MAVNKRKKFQRKRGSRTCGYGVSHRGAGERGGRGRAGTGKKGKCKMPKKGKWTIQYFGKKGFKSKGIAHAKHYTINLRQLEQMLDNFIKDKAAVLEKDIYTINLTDLGIDKLLSTGKVTNKLKINVNFASKKAVEKVKSAGGDVVLPKVEAKKVPKTEEKGKE